MTNLATEVKDNPEGTPTQTQTSTTTSTSTPAQAQASWLDSLSDDLKGNESLKKFKDVSAVAKSYVELEKHIGGTLKIPTDTSKPEEWEAFYNKLGRPEKPEGYGIKKPDNLPSGLEWNDDLEKGFRIFAHKNGLSDRQAQSLVGYWTEIMTKQAEAFWTEAKGLAALETEFKDEKVRTDVLSSAQRAIKELADKDFIEFLEQTGAGNHPSVLKFLAKINKFFDEDTLPDNFTPGSTGVGVNEANAEIARIRNDKSHPYHKGDAEAVAYMSKLYEAAKGRKVLLTIG